MFPRLNGKEVGSDPLQDRDDSRPDANKHGDCLIVLVKRSFTRWSVTMREIGFALASMPWIKCTGANAKLPERLVVAFSAPFYALFGRE